MRTLTMALGIALALVVVPEPGSAQSPAGVAEGAVLYGQNCIRCHSARSPMERTDREWVTIVNHMRVRANLRKSQALALVTFLQATNAAEASATAELPAAAASGDDVTTDPLVTAGVGDPSVILLDLTDPRLSVEARQAIERYLRSIRRPAGRDPGR